MLFQFLDFEQFKCMLIMLEYRKIVVFIFVYNMRERQKGEEIDVLFNIIFEK